MLLYEISVQAHTRKFSRTGPSRTYTTQTYLHMYHTKLTCTLSTNLRIYARTNAKILPDRSVFCYIYHTNLHTYTTQTYLHTYHTKRTYTLSTNLRTCSYTPKQSSPSNQPGKLLPAGNFFPVNTGQSSGSGSCVPYVAG